MNNILYDIAKISKDFMFKEPFYGLFLITLNKVIRKDIRTAGVSKNGINAQLAINDEYWSSLKDDVKMGLLKHELLHIVFFHLLMREDFQDNQLFNIAADIEVNQYIDRNMCMDNWIFIESFPELNLQPRQGTRYYYEQLMTALQNNSCPKLTDLYNQLQQQSTDMHSTWEEFSTGDAEKGLIKRQIDYQVKEIIEQNKKNLGHIPGELKNYIDSLFIKEEPVFNWKAYLRRFAGSSIKTYTKKTRRKLNKRFAGLPSLKIKTKKNILIGVDTSGSVSNTELEEFFNEIHHIWKTGCMVTVVQCDASIHHIESYEGSFTKKQATVYGRGGTSFQPVIDYYNQNHKKYSTLIYLTDGECGAPTKPRGSMLWVISSKGRINNSLPCAQIKIP